MSKQQQIQAVKVPQALAQTDEAKKPITTQSSMHPNVIELQKKEKVMATAQSQMSLMRTSINSESKPNSMQQTLRARSGLNEQVNTNQLGASIRAPDDKMLATVREELKSGGLTERFGSISPLLERDYQTQLNSTLMNNVQSRSKVASGLGTVSAKNAISGSLTERSTRAKERARAILNSTVQEVRSTLQGHRGDGKSMSKVASESSKLKTVSGQVSIKQTRQKTQAASREAKFTRTVTLNATLAMPKLSSTRQKLAGSKNDGSAMARIKVAKMSTGLPIDGRRSSADLAELASAASRKQSIKHNSRMTAAAEQNQSSARLRSNESRDKPDVREDVKISERLRGKTSLAFDQTRAANRLLPKIKIDDNERTRAQRPLSSLVDQAGQALYSERYSYASATRVGSPAGDEQKKKGAGPVFSLTRVFADSIQNKRRANRRDSRNSGPNNGGFNVTHTVLRGDYGILSNSNVQQIEREKSFQQELHKDRDRSATAKIKATVKVVEDYRETSHGNSQSREPISLMQGSLGISTLKAKAHDPDADKAMRQKKDKSKTKVLDSTPAVLSLSDVHAIAIQSVTPATAPQHPARSAALSQQPDVSKFNSQTSQLQKGRKPSEFKVAFNMPQNLEGKNKFRGPHEMMNTSRFSELSKTLTEKAEDKRKKNDQKVVMTQVSKPSEAQAKPRSIVDEPVAPVKQIALVDRTQHTKVLSPRLKPNVSGMTKENRAKEQLNETVQIGGVRDASRELSNKRKTVNLGQAQRMTSTTRRPAAVQETIVNATDVTIETEQSPPQQRKSRRDRRRGGHRRDSGFAYAKASQQTVQAEEVSEPLMSQLGLPSEQYSMMGTINNKFDRVNTNQEPSNRVQRLEQLTQKVLVEDEDQNDAAEDINMSMQLDNLADTALRKQSIQDPKLTSERNRRSRHARISIDATITVNEQVATPKAAKKSLSKTSKNSKSITQQPSGAATDRHSNRLNKLNLSNDALNATEIISTKYMSSTTRGLKQAAESGKTSKDKSARSKKREQVRIKRSVTLTAAKNGKDDSEFQLEQQIEINKNQIERAADKKFDRKFDLKGKQDTQNQNQQNCQVLLDSQKHIENQKHDQVSEKTRRSHRSEAVRLGRQQINHQDDEPTDKKSIERKSYHSQQEEPSSMAYNQNQKITIVGPGPQKHETSSQQLMAKLQSPKRGTQMSYMQSTNASQAQSIHATGFSRPRGSNAGYGVKKTANVVGGNRTGGAIRRPQLSLERKNPADHLVARIGKKSKFALMSGVGLNFQNDSTQSHSALMRNADLVYPKAADFSSRKSESKGHSISEAITLQTNNLHPASEKKLNTSKNSGPTSMQQAISQQLQKEQSSVRLKDSAAKLRNLVGSKDSRQRNNRNIETALQTVQSGILNKTPGRSNKRQTTTNIGANLYKQSVPKTAGRQQNNYFVTKNTQPNQTLNHSINSRRSGQDDLNLSNSVNRVREGPVRQMSLKANISGADASASKFLGIGGVIGDKSPTDRMSKIFYPKSRDEEDNEEDGDGPGHFGQNILGGTYDVRDTSKRAKGKASVALKNVTIGFSDRAHRRNQGSLRTEKKHSKNSSKSPLKVGTHRLSTAAIANKDLEINEDNIIMYNEEVIKSSKTFDNINDMHSMPSTNQYLRAQLPQSNDVGLIDMQAIDEARASEEDRRMRAQSRLLAVSKSPSKKSMQLQKILKSINVTATARVPGGSGNSGHIIRSEAKKRKTTGAKGSLAGTSATKQQNVELKTSTAKSSSLIRNFINQVSSSAHASTLKNYHLNPSQATQRQSNNRQAQMSISPAKTRPNGGTQLSSSNSQNALYSDVKVAQSSSQIDTYPSNQAKTFLHSQISHVNPYINSKVRSSVHGGSRTTSGVFYSGEKPAEQVPGSNAPVLTHSPVAKQIMPAIGTPGRVPDSIFANTGGSLSSARSKGLTQSKTTSVLPQTMVSPAYKNIKNNEGYGFSALHVKLDAPINSYSQAQSSALSKRSNNSMTKNNGRQNSFSALSGNVQLREGQEAPSGGLITEGSCIPPKTIEDDGANFRTGNVVDGRDPDETAVFEKDESSPTEHASATFNQGSGVGETFERKLNRKSDDSLLVAHRVDTSVAMPNSSEQAPTVFNSNILGGDELQHQTKQSEEQKQVAQQLRSEDIEEVLSMSAKLVTPKRVGDMVAPQSSQLGAKPRTLRKQRRKSSKPPASNTFNSMNTTNEQESDVAVPIKKETKYMAISLSNDNLMEQVNEVGEQSLESSVHGSKVNVLEADHPYQDSHDVSVMQKEVHPALLNEPSVATQLESVTRVADPALAPKKKLSAKPDIDNKELVRSHQLQQEKEKLYNERKAGTQRAEAALKEQQKQEAAKKAKEALFPMSYETFLELFRERMLPEEIEELGPGEKQFDMVYYPGNIPERTPQDLQQLIALNEEKKRVFEEKKREAEDLNNGEFQGNPCFDNFEGYYKVEIGEHLGYRFEIMKVLGKGSFAQVVKCRDHKKPDKPLHAVKITRNTEMDHKFAHKEAHYLRYIMQEDPNDKHNIVRMLDHAYFRDHHCFVFELLHTDLFEHLKATGFVGFSTDKIRDYAVQILKGLVFLEKHKIIHCDLKPENILCADPICRTLKIVDFGSGCFRDEQIYTYVQSRFYRSPEVIMRIRYTEKVDIWSLGCILAELYTGEPLFPGNNEQEQLELIMELCGMPPETMIDKSRKKDHYFDTDYSPFLIEDEHLGILRIPNSRSIREAVPSDDDDFLDFILNCCEIDPESRFSASEAMEHPWIKSAHLSQHTQSRSSRQRLSETDSMLQPQILREKEVREREGQEVIAETSPEREILVQRKKPGPPKETFFGITVNNLNDTQHRIHKQVEHELQAQSQPISLGYNSALSKGSFVGSQANQLGHYATDNVGLKPLGMRNSHPHHDVSFQAAMNTSTLSKRTNSLIDAQVHDEEEKEVAETPSNQQMMDIKSIIPPIDYTNKYVSVAARQSLPGASRSQMSYSNVKDQAESRSMLSELPEDVTVGRPLLLGDGGAQSQQLESSPLKTRKSHLAGDLHR